MLGGYSFRIHLFTFRRIKGFRMVIHSKDHAEAYPVEDLMDDAGNQRR